MRTLIARHLTPKPARRAGTGGGEASAEEPMSGVRDVVEVLARALTDRPDEVRVTESQHKGTTLIELFVAPGRPRQGDRQAGAHRGGAADAGATAGEKEGKTVTLEIRDGKP